MTQSAPLPKVPVLGRLLMVPVPVAEGAIASLSADVVGHTLHLTRYFVEDLRTARRVLRAIHPGIDIDAMQFSVIDKHAGPDTALLKNWLSAGKDVGVMSEAGCPGIADPGAVLAAVAHELGAPVVPLVGPSSLLLALMASGLNGQNFCFRGYLPVKEPMRSKTLKEWETASVRDNQTQLFIETPYRNQVLLEVVLKTCSPRTRLCIAQNVTAPNAFVRTLTIKDWKTKPPVLGKEPAVFLLLG